MSKTKRFLALVLIVLMLASSLAISASAAPEAPAKVTATQSSSVIRLTWSKVSGATGYRIYYKIPRDLHWKTCVSSTTKTTYRFTDLPSGEVYIFGIKSYTKSGSKMTWSSMKQITTATEPGTPKKVTASQTESSIKVNWSEVKGATGYRVYYKATGNKEWKKLTSTDDTTYTLTGRSSGKKYDFAIKPYIKTSSGVIWGEKKTIGTATKPATPKTLDLQADPYNNTATLSWSKVSRADAYRIYQREYGEEAWRVAVKSTTGTSYTIKNLPDNQYEFAVMALVKTTSGTICGYYRWTRGNMYSPTTAPITTMPTTMAPTTSPATTQITRRGMHPVINETGTDSQGRFYATINKEGWDGEFKPNSARVTVYVDGKAMNEKVILQISSSTTGDGYQYMYINLEDYGVDTSSSTISFTIPEGFLQNKAGTRFNYACEVSS